MIMKKRIRVIDEILFCSGQFKNGITSDIKVAREAISKSQRIVALLCPNENLESIYRTSQIVDIRQKKGILEIETLNTVYFSEK